MISRFKKGKLIYISTYWLYHLLIIRLCGVLSRQTSSVEFSVNL